MAILRILLTLFVALIVGCSSNPAITFHSPVPGATLMEKGTGKHYGPLPVRIEYVWNPAYVNARGCMQVNGMDAVWVSGHRETTHSVIELCQGISEYNVGIPYNGDQTKVAIDLQHAQVLEYQRQVKDQQTAAIITAVGNSLSSALTPQTPTNSFNPAPTLVTPVQAPSQSFAPNTYTNNRNQFCSGFEEGYRSIKGSLTIVPLCPIMPVIPVGSTAYREGLLAGQRAGR